MSAQGVTAASTTYILPFYSAPSKSRLFSSRGLRARARARLLVPSPDKPGQEVHITTVTIDIDGALCVPIASPTYLCPVFYRRFAHSPDPTVTYGSVLLIWSYCKPTGENTVTPAASPASTWWGNNPTAATL